ncbi:sugar transferase [Pseudonocardia sp. RS010]|uniref:sugar transferase n=1 Tax=Pseudonocardia sp. RS010 TaxID=3385979 RepID=UPI00399F3CC9
MFNPSEVTVPAGVPAVPAQRSASPVAGRPVDDEGGPVRWQRRLRSLVVLSDVTTVLGATGLAVLAGWTGIYEAKRAQLVCGAIAAALLLIAMPLARAWDGRILGVGSTEFKRLGRAVVGAAVALALGGLILLVASVRIWVFFLVPLIGCLVALGRFGIRKWLHRQRGRGRAMLSVLAVGDERAVADMIRRTRRDPHFGWRIDGACTPTGRGLDGAASIEDVPVVGDLDSVGPAVLGQGYRVVSVCQAPGWGPKRLHRLAWELEGTETELAVAPGLMEIAGPRMHIAPVDGLPLLRLSEPRFTGVARVLKTVVDRTAAVLLLLLAAPLFLAVAVAVKLDGGPVFFRQERVGTNGRTFHMVKFRSMVVDAEAKLAELRAGNEAAGPLFKMARDPRITKVGAVLRRYSLDELPQLLNVLGGSMSLVGPRPPLPAEVATYEDVARRRLLVRPGMTGLWQVSGRSNLSWEESVRLDLRYVENWSMALDLTILWKTLGAVLRSRGAY